MGLTKHTGAQSGTIKFGWEEDHAGITGIAGGLGMQPQELKLAGSPEFVAKAEALDGTVAAMAIAPIGRQFTLTGYVTDVTKFNDAVSFSYDSKYYVISGRSLDASNKEYMKGEVTGSQHDLITAGAALTYGGTGGA